MMKKIITDERFNSIYKHPVGTKIKVTWISGKVLEYTVNGVIYYTSIDKCKKYSK